MPLLLLSVIYFFLLFASSSFILILYACKRHVLLNVFALLALKWHALVFFVFCTNGRPRSKGRELKA